MSSCFIHHALRSVLLVKREHMDHPRISHLVDTVTSILGEDCVFSKELLYVILRKGGANLNTKIGLRDEQANIHTDLQFGYTTTSSFEPMVRDKWRNRYFRDAISRVGQATWLELGPGATGVLSLLVMEAHPKNILCAIEAVETSARRVSAMLEREHPGRSQVITGLAGDVEVHPAWQFDALVAEILGHVASCEGYVHILHQFARAYPSLRSTLRHAVPAYFGTMAVPVDLSGVVSGLRIGSLHKRLALFNKLPFSQAQLSAHHQPTELYSTLDELRRHGEPQVPRVLDCEWTVEGQQHQRPFHGLALYVVYGDSSCGPCQTANADEPYASTNWFNVFVPVAAGRLLCSPGDVTGLRSICHVEKEEPAYEFHVSLWRKGVMVDTSTGLFDYKDIVCEVASVRDLRIHCK